MSIKLDMTTARAANLTADDNGQWIVWQADPGVCLGIGATRDEAITDAIRCGVAEHQIDDDDIAIDTLSIVD